MVEGRQHPPQQLADARRPLLAAGGAAGDPAVLAVSPEVLAEIRRAKSEAKRSMRADVTKVVVADTAERLAALAGAVEDVKAAGVVTELETTDAPEFSVAVWLPPAE